MTSPSSQAQKHVSSPAATGGAGTHFEQHVDAAFLTLLLVKGIPPVLTDCTVDEVNLQVEHLGWATDDVVVAGVNGGGDRRRLLCQVKRSFTVSASDDDCRKTLGDFWQDFRKNASFAPTNDHFAIIVQRGTTALLHHFGSLLDCARSSRDVADFEHRLQTVGFLDSRAAGYYRAIETILSDIEERPVSAEEVWPLLKLIHIINFDLNTSTRQTESLLVSLLAHTSKDADPIGAAKATWSELVEEAADGMANAKRYGYDDLPATARNRHSVIADTDTASLQRLKEHSAVILKDIRTAIGPGVHLRRDRLVQVLLAQLEADQVVIVAGPAGSGKSAIAKGALEELPEHFAFSFRAEEFEHSHVDESLQNMQVGLNAATLGALLGGQSRKLLLVESVERLLEASTRDSFSDLLRLVKDDPSWQLILTCRDYSAELVRSSMLQFAGIPHSALSVPPLDDAELDAAVGSLPLLLRPVSNARLKRLLRNPYLLDKASQMEWPEDRPLPEDERAFRDKFWIEIVRADHKPADDMPRRREDAFVEVALQRARAMTQYVSRRDIDAIAVLALRHDSLLAFSADSDLLVAPAHDVLEDWAILRWIEEQYIVCGQVLPQMAGILGTHAAIRRTYRKWVTELVEHDAAAADRLMDTVINAPSLSGQFRDDTLVSLLQSPASIELLQRHAASLFANDRQLLRRIMHLVRVACVKTPSWLGPEGAAASLMHIPDGGVWKCVLDLLAANLDTLDAADLPLLLGFLEDASRGVSWQSPYPEGSDAISCIAYWLLPLYGGYRWKERRKRVLQIIAKIPRCNPGDFEKLLIGGAEAEDRRRAREGLREIVLGGMEGMPACRDLPDVVIAALRDELLLTEEMRDSMSYSAGMQTEPTFGINERAHYGSFPASAFHGPFLALLKHHPSRAITFLIGLLNHSAEWYGTRRVPMQFVEPPFAMSLTCVDGSTARQWCNARLWNLYRGTSVGPYVLQSAMMALEQWLLDVGEARPEELDSLLCNLLRRSVNIALTAVVAAVATAFPHACPETLLVLLSARECILLDRGRLASEAQAASLTGFTLLRDAIQRVYDDERQKSNRLPHRAHDLEWAIANLQLGPHAGRVQGIIDEHRRNMSPVDEQTELDRMWRLALHRMDLRQYTVSSHVREEGEPTGEGGATDNAGRRMIRFDLQKAEPDIQEMVDSCTQDYAAMNARVSLLMWGTKVFSREEPQSYDPSQWRSRLEESRSQKATTSPKNEAEPGEGGTELVASVCLRDHLDDLVPEELAWCVETVCDGIERHANDWHPTERMQRFPMGGDRACAFVLSNLIGKSLPTEQQERVRGALACAVLHPIDEVRAYAAAGVGYHLWASDPQLAARCVSVLATEAKTVQERWETEQMRPFNERVPHEEIELDVAIDLRDRFYEDFDEDAYGKMDVGDWTGSEANCRILSILGRAPEEPRAIDAFRRLAAVLVQWWDDDEDRKSGTRRDRSVDVEVGLTSLLEEFVLNVSPAQAAAILEPVLEAFDRHPRHASQILQGIVGVEDRIPRTQQFWHVWELFAVRVQQVTWLPRLDNEYSPGEPAMAAVFLTQYWKDDVEHWRSLEGHAFHVHRLFEALPPSGMTMDDYARFLYHIGRESLPMAFRHIANRLRAGDAQVMLRKANTVFLLEVLLRPYVYGRPMELKRDPDLRDSVLFLLDELVERGSSAAYRMRDDFITPIAGM